MSTVDRMWLLIKMLKETYDNELSRQQRRLKNEQNLLTEEDKNSCNEIAKKAVLVTGISMYQFNQLLKKRYQRTAEYPAIHQTVNKGIENGFLKWGAPRRIDFERGEEGQNIVFTERGFEIINQTGTQLAITTIHSAYLPKIRGIKHGFRR